MENEEGLWQDIVNLRYGKDTNVCLIQSKFSDSPP
jgi:hypothetical protein